MDIFEVFRWTYIMYFVTHIPITLCIDLQGVVGAKYYPKMLIDLFSWYISTYGDFLMKRPPIWLKSFLVCLYIFIIKILFN